MKFQYIDRSDVSFEGPVWIGDPCYLFESNDEKWSAFLAAMGDDGAVKTPHGIVWVWGTAYGDGEYPVMDGALKIGSCPVDAGLLCITNLGTAYKLRRNKKRVKDSGCITEAKGTPEEFERGNVGIGRIHVLTDYDDPEDE